MKKHVILLVGLLALAACGQRGYVDEGFCWEEAGENPFYGQTLTITVLHDRNQGKLRSLASLYMARNPGVTIEIEMLGTGRWDFYEVQILRENMRVQIMAGQMPMLIDPALVDVLSRDFFADWMPLIEAHPRFNDEEWFMGAIYALADGGELLSFGTYIGFTYVAANTHIPGLADAFAGLQTVSAEDILRLYLDFDVQGLGKSATYWLMLWEPLLLAREFFDYGSGFVNFSDPEFVRLLEITKDAFGQPLQHVIDERNRGSDWQALSARYFAFETFSPFSLGWLELFYEDSSFVNAVPFANNRGEVYVRNFSGSGWALSRGATSTQQALALDFIRFTQDTTDADVDRIHERTPSIILGPIPLARDKFMRHTNRYAQGIAFSASRALRYSPAEMSDNIFKRTYGILNSPMSAMPFVPDIVRGFVGTTLWELMQGMASPSDAAMRMQNTVTLMLMEGN